MATIVRTRMGKTTIELYEETADALHDLKSRGDTYDDVVRDLIEEQTETTVDAPGSNSGAD